MLVVVGVGVRWPVGLCNCVVWHVVCSGHMGFHAVACVHVVVVIQVVNKSGPESWRHRSLARHRYGEQARGSSEGVDWAACGDGGDSAWDADASPRQGASFHMVGCVLDEFLAAGGLQRVSQV